MIREELKKYKNRRVRIRGRLQRYGKWYDWRIKQHLLSACIEDVEIDNQQVCDHVWLQYADPLQDIGVEPGDTIEMNALVGEYVRISGGRDFNLKSPDSIVIIHRPVYLHQVRDMPADAQPEPESQDPNPEFPATDPPDAVELMRRVKKLAHDAGGVKRLRDLVDFLVTFRE